MTSYDFLVIALLIGLGVLFLGCTLLARHDKLTEEERERIRESYRDGKWR